MISVETISQNWALTRKGVSFSTTVDIDDSILGDVSNKTKSPVAIRSMNDMKFIRKKYASVR